ncbi:MAG TPA: hypothetical protein PLG92_01460 [Piscinibacter sp.]|nr:hypothetical protein [Burkholderiaceae bacterium]HNK17018.1 hypothetical protein [Piscinibacter sp.]
MKQPSTTKRRTAALLLSIVLSAGAWAQETVRPEVGKPMQAAQELMRAGKYKDALARLREAEAVPGRTPYETYLLDRMRGSAAAGAGDDATALAAFESALATSYLQKPERLQILEALAGTAYRAKDWKRVISFAERHAAEGGASASLDKLRLNAYFQSGDYAGVVKALQSQVQAAEKPQPQVDESTLRMLAASQAQLKDDEGYLATLEKLLRYHPKKEYWADVLARVARQPGMLDRQALDYLRLSFATQTLEDGERYVELATLAMQAGLPAEARRVIESGYAAGVLGSGAEADRHRRLRDLATKQAAEDVASLKPDVVGRTPDANLAVGQALVSIGRIDQGLPLIEQSVGRSGLKRPDEARLHLGQAYLAAGQPEKAAEAFAEVTTSGPVATLARLWRLHALGLRRAESR